MAASLRPPPNELLSLFEEDAVPDVVVILSEPEPSDGDLSYAVEVTEGERGPCASPPHAGHGDRGHWTPDRINEQAGWGCGA